jgi:hypothetical protein
MRYRAMAAARRAAAHMSRNEFRLREANEQPRNFISGHGFAE